METVIERLMYFHSFLQTNYGFQGRNWLESSLGLSTGYLTRALKRKSAIGSDLLVGIFNLFPSLSMKWLILGEGKMLVTDRGLRLRSIRLSRGYSTSEFASILGCIESFYLKMESGEIPLNEEYRDILLTIGVKEEQIPFAKYADVLEFNDTELVELTTNLNVPRDYNTLASMYDKLIGDYEKLQFQYDELKEKYSLAITKIGELVVEKTNVG